ncbi:SusC/RagA family TonB-linked outer membrane protein [Flavobacterium sp. LB2P53]|uniref:SusC/RagA family TonB-linked outer membrane protein n=1 Tax=Flavobacterium sp. LB2P53 TaxID=2497481 RepID=UPI000F831C9D|nr:SusC/RagA family TonB-linked outer membrane protein [Flavobacterium sp. LB2P53]RTY71354.1 SusC/RagA family TonB-linked outer membrane protein [Flavobacterium sp. LB2P53]
MKLKFNGFLVLLLVLVTQLTFAQERSVSGIVSDNAGIPIPGVSVLVKGTKSGIQTDFDGKFSIKATSSQILIFSFIGMKTQEISASSITLKVKMADESVELEGVIVTAQGIKREKKSLGYAVSEIKSADIEQRAEGDVARVLSGKASGVTINQTSGISGSGTSINIRGLNSISGNTQPLFIVDGVPFSGDTNASGNFANGNSGSSRFLDLDPNNIANVNILKGYAATTLYGTAGRNGVILITTKGGAAKKGSKKTEITVNQSLFFNQIASLPDYQNKFGNGFDQAYGNFFSNWGPGFYEKGLGGYAAAGSGINSNGTVPHPYSRASLATVFPELQGTTVPYTAKPDNVKDFFRVGAVTNTSINIAGGSDDGNTTYNFNFGNLNDEGFTPGNVLKRTSFSVGGRSKLSNKFTISGTMNFARTDFLTPPVARSNGSGVQGTGLSIFADVFYTPRNVDIQNYPFQNPVTGSNLSYRSGNDILNPYWTLNNSSVRQLTNRTFGNAALSYDIDDNLKLNYRVGYDFYNERNVIGTNIGAPRGPVQGEYSTYDNNNMIWDHNIMMNGTYNLTDKIGFNFTAGATSRQENFDRQGVRSVGQQVYGILRHYNFGTQSPIQYSELRNVVGVYGLAEFDYNKYLYLTLSARKDWISNTFENTITYPAASLAFIASDALEGITSEKGLNYLKLRAGYGTSAGFAPSYPVANTLGSNARDFSDLNGVVNPAQLVSSRLGNAKLKPELLTELEFGFDSKFFNNRVSLNASYFKRTTTDLITETPIANSTGFLTTFTNIGELKGHGIEVDLDVHVIKNNANGFNWEIGTNFFKGEMIVTDLGDLERVTVAGFTNLGNQAIEGEQIGVMVGSRIKRDANNNFVVNSIGAYQIEAGPFIIGNPNPDFTLNTSNNFSYKNINLSFLISYVSGGDIYSGTTSSLLARGLTTDTENRLQTFILPGVKADGSPNDIQLNNSSYYFDNIGFGPDELSVYDGSVIRLNEISLGYSFPAKYLNKSPFGSLTFSVAGYNLYYNAFNTPKGINFDPNVVGTGVGNGRGFDFLNGPSGKRYGFSLKASF